LIYSQKRNCAASLSIVTFLYLWAIYIFPRSVHIFPCCSIGRPILGIYKSLTDAWDWGRAIPFLGILFRIFGIMSLQCRICLKMHRKVIFVSTPIRVHWIHLNFMFLFFMLLTYLSVLSILQDPTLGTPTPRRTLNSWQLRACPTPWRPRRPPDRRPGPAANHSLASRRPGSSEGAFRRRQDDDPLLESVRDLSGRKGSMCVCGGETSHPERLSHEID
jgi:hypothetical protein